MRRTAKEVVELIVVHVILHVMTVCVRGLTLAIALVPVMILINFGGADRRWRSWEEGIGDCEKDALDHDTRGLEDERSSLFALLSFCSLHFHVWSKLSHCSES